MNYERRLGTKMMILSSKELGIKNCDLVISGDHAGDIVDRMVDHLRSEHDLDMPEPDVILSGNVSDDPLGVTDPSVELVVTRMIHALNIAPVEETEEVHPPIPRTPTLTQ